MAQHRMSARRLVVVTLVVVTGLVMVNPLEALSGEVVTLEYSPQQGPPGTAISFSGACSRGNEVHISVARNVASSGGESFRASQTYPVPNGQFSGVFTVPVEALPGDYSFGAMCLTQDQVYGTVLEPFVVTDETPIPTSSTTSSTSSTTSTTVSTTSSTIEPSVSSTPTLSDPTVEAKGTDSELPRTGGGVALSVLAAITALTCGFGMLVWARRRSTADGR